MILLDKALEYANECVSGENITTWEVRKQCEIFLEDYKVNQYKDDFEFYFDEKKLKKVNNLLKLFNMATGFNENESALSAIWGFQALLLVNIFGWRYKNDSKRFRYREVLLFIPRKNAKGTMCAWILILGMLLEQKFSNFFSIATSKKIAAELREQIVQIISTSPAINKHFKCSKQEYGKVTCSIKGSKYEPLSSDRDNNLNSFRGTYLILDEVGAFTTRKATSTLISGQKSVQNPMAFYTTSAYAESNSIIYEELDYYRKILKGESIDRTRFCLIYYAEDGEEYEDSGIIRANPLRLERNIGEIKQLRDKARILPSLQEDYLAKSVNKMLETKAKNEHYLDMSIFRKYKKPKQFIYEKYNGRKVSLGVDLSKTIDLSSVSIMTKDDDGYIYCSSLGFIPENTIFSPNRTEKIDYYVEAKNGNVKIQKGNTIRVLDICNYIRKIEEAYKCEIECIYYDGSYAEILERELENDYDMLKLRQTYTELSKYYKKFRDDLYEGKVFYAENNLLDYCASCSQVSTGKAGDIMVLKDRKNKSEKIDLLITIPFAYAHWYIEEEEYDAVKALMSEDWG